MRRGMFRNESPIPYSHGVKHSRSSVMKVVLVLLGLVLIAVIAAPALAQARGQSPTNDAPAATITGRVVGDSSGDPIPNARVTLSPESPTLPVVLTDADGRFSLAAPAGVHTVAVRKAGYARDDATPSVPGRAVEIRLKRGAAISGQVLDELGDPVIGIHVFVQKQTDSAKALTIVGEADTDDRGEYRFGGLSDGAFLASIAIATPMQRPGSSLVLASQQPMYYPGVATPGQAQALRVQPGDERNGIDFIVPAGHSSGLSVATLAFQLRRPPLPNSAPRGTGVVRGRVADLGGRPIGHAQVLVFADTRADSRATTTNENGAFEVGELGAGTVRISATAPGYTQLESGHAVTPWNLDLGPVRAGTLSGFAWGRAIDLAPGEIRDRIDVTMARWGTLSGRVTDEYGDPVQGAGVQLLHVRYDAGQRQLVPVDAVMAVTDDLGRYRLHSLTPGQYMVSAAVGQVSLEDLSGYARSYYPGTPNPGEGQFVSVGLSEDVTAVDFSLSRVRTARVAGQVLNPTGDAAPPGTLILRASRRSSSVTSVPVGAQIAPDGAFSFPNVPPGQYTIQTYRGRVNPHTDGEFGALPVTVNGADVTGLTLRTSSGSSIAGRVTFDAEDRTRIPSPSAIEIAPVSVDVDLAPPNNSGVSAEIHEDWTFELAGLHGPQRLQILRAPREWALKEIRMNGIDVTDRPLSLGERNQSVANLEVVMTDRVTELSGAIVDERGRPTPGSTVVVFSTDRDRWYPASRYLQTSTGSDGMFTVAGLPAGSYYVSAVARIPMDGVDA
jgi:protocatechuate 3,4-dioxygenase beta subunit